MKEKDYLGNEIVAGLRALRVRNYAHSAEFRKVLIVRVDTTRPEGDTVGILTDGKSRIGWTYPNRLIIETGLTNKI